MRCAGSKRLLIVGNAEHLMVLSGNGDVIEPDEGIAAIGSGGPVRPSCRDRAVASLDARCAETIAREALGIASKIDIYTNDDIIVEVAHDIRRNPDCTNLHRARSSLELDRYIVGQAKAKRAVAIALRNRYRRDKLPDDMRADIIPKNILMIGPTGVGKTEIARRLANLAGAPFIKVEATKYTEVGYVGRDVESMVRDLAEAAIRMVRDERRAEVVEAADRAAVERVVDLLHPETRPPAQAASKPVRGDDSARSSATISVAVNQAPHAPPAPVIR